MRSTYQGLLLQTLLRAQQITVDLRPLADVRAGAEREETLSRAGGGPQYIDQFITAQPREDVPHCIALRCTVQHLLESTVVFLGGQDQPAPLYFEPTSTMRVLYRRQDADYQYNG